MRALLIAISVLIITCPCALGLAVPVVQVVAAGRLFRSGIMVKDGSGMERLAEIDSVVFDKTGTLTLGRPRLRQASGKPADQAMAAAMAAHSRHPLSQALHASHSGPLPLIGSVREYPGEGFLVSTGAGEYRLGKRSFACANKLDKPVSGSASEVVLSLNGDERAQFLLEDAVRTDAEIAMDRLHSMGLSTAILSGDRLPVVAAMGRRLGIANWKASLTPREKAGICTGLATEGRKVLMVGDGINDAPALSTAHVSMAPATAADIGRQAADFVFMHDSLLAVPLAIEISRRAGRLIRENFALAIGYNIIAVPIALAGMATPLIASVAMSTSSIIVVANALRLNRMLQNDGQASRDQPKQTVEAPTSKARLA
jgi:Cu2+-exporting ATPase